MTLTAHAITGATLATLIPNYPILGFIVGFGSHFILDAIPHWEYPLASVKEDKKNPMNNDMIVGKNFYRDLFKIGIDGVLGLTLSFLLLRGIFHHSLLVIFLGAAGGMAPDALQFFYFKWKHEPLISLQHFHNWIHPKISLDHEPLVGILSQIVIICLVIGILK
jgi:hypothetical protein